MRKDKIKYSLNAVLYYLWLFDMGAGEIIGKFVHVVLSPIYFSLYLLPKESSNRFLARQRQGRKVLREFRRNKQNGLSIWSAVYVFDGIYFGYCMILCMPLGGLMIRLQGVLNMFIIMPLYFVIGYICYGFVKNRTLKDNLYIRYFEEFEKEDEAWHRKWKWITFVFFIGGFLSLALGIFIAFYCHSRCGQAMVLMC